MDSADAAPGDPSVDASVADDGGAPPSSEDGAAPSPDGSTSPPPSTDGGADGVPTRQQCTASLGSALTTAHARLDGYVVSIIPPGQGRQCNGDSSHVHLQVLMSKGIYDVAANVDGRMFQKDAPLAGGAWSEGWHTQDALDYPSGLGVHSTDFTLTGVNVVAAEVEKQLAAANHVSVYCTGYGPDGCHLVHRKKGNQDGAIVVDPLSPTSHWLLFDFDTDQF